MLEKFLDYIIAHQGKKVFPGWARHEIKFVLIKAISDQSFLSLVDTDGEIQALALGYPVDYNKVHVICVIANSRSQFKELLRFCREKFPNLSLQGYRHNNLQEPVQFPVSRLEQISSKL